MISPLNTDSVKANSKGKVVLFYPHFGEKQQSTHWFPFPYLYLAPFLEKTGYKVVIAAHPGSEYNLHKDYFGGRHVIKGQTQQLIKNSTKL